MKDNKKEFLLIDGSSLIFRAFYAIRNLTTQDGIFTNGVYGFLSMYYKAVELLEPDYVCVAFDRSTPTFRVKDYAEYKGTRQETPDELKAQFGMLKDVLDAMHITHIDLDGFEADDILGTLSTRANEKGIQSYLLTGDRDYFQLVDTDTKVLYTKKGISELAEYDLKAIEEEYGVTPKQLIEVKGLQGDTSDNIPGVPGVGPKTAIKLIQDYGNIEGVYENIDRISGKKLVENLKEHETIAYLSRKLGTIYTDVPLDQKLEDFALVEPDKERLSEIFRRLEFKGFLERLDLPVEQVEMSFSETEFVETKDVVHRLQELSKLEEITFAVLGSKENYIHADPVYLILTGHALDQTYLFDLRKPLSQEAKSHLMQIFTSKTTRKVCFDIKESIVLLDKIGVDLHSPYEDIMLMEYLIDPTRSSYTIGGLSNRVLGQALPGKEELLGKGAKRLEWGDVEASDLLQYASTYKKTLETAKPELLQTLKDREMEPLFYEIENPLARVLARMEIVGVQVDPSVLQTLSVEYGELLQQLEADIYEAAGVSFNINSPKQLGEILFEKMGLPAGKKTKTGYSTSADVLEKLKSADPIVPLILQYRQIAKLNSTYVEGLLAVIDEDQRIRTTFQQSIAATGRISSKDPNLQNIPIRSEEGRRLRAVFVSKEGDSLIDADYSQIELRVLAHLSGDQTMIDAFNHNVDIHTKTASEVNHVSLEEVTPLQRARAKAVNFGIVYGISDYGLSQDLDISRKEAKEYIEGYKDTYPDIRKYMDQIVQDAKDKGYVETYFNRRRYIPELSSKNFAVRGFGERVALNTPIQGTAADIIKIAMVRVDEALQSKGYDARLVLQIHDELIVEAPDSEVEAVSKLLIEIMEGVVNLDVSLDADMSVGKSWDEAK